jgi:hypothetical protein
MRTTGRACLREMHQVKIMPTRSRSRKNSFKNKSVRRHLNPLRINLIRIMMKRNQKIRMGTKIKLVVKLKMRINLYKHKKRKKKTKSKRESKNHKQKQKTRVKTTRTNLQSLRKSRQKNLKRKELCHPKISI